MARRRLHETGRGDLCARRRETRREPPAERNVDSYRGYFAEFLDEDGDVRNYIQEALDAGMTTRDIDVEDHEALESVDRARPSYRSVT
ncbi:hypothetical protein [Haloplanus salinarum]|uniref:hypothetical protein n=1 Tax=Haloplanus salinarum TaxID=1912324 RepID=UPI00214BCAEB|nr:hypothetical protein [Haloplanus salinarum]